MLDVIKFDKLTKLNQ